MQWERVRREPRVVRRVGAAHAHRVLKCAGIVHARGPPIRPPPAIATPQIAKIRGAPPASFCPASVAARGGPFAAFAFAFFAFFFLRFGGPSVKCACSAPACGSRWMWTQF